jgi:hypothetical protein
VQEGGDYLLRDGTITVTFAEVAVWKNNPNAHFQLMRKHPIQGVPRYVLGRRVEGEFASDISSLIYQSSNGDTWSLTKDLATGAPPRRHAHPHPQSGGMYDNLIAKIQSFGDWWHHLESTWIVRCVRSPREIRHELKSYIGTNDQLLVIKISGDTAEWTGVNDAGSRWLQDNI